MGSFVFDPKIWILPPYRTCPNCGRPDSFGVLMINATSMVRRCRECWYDQQFPLPDVDKTIVYLDQMAISNMTKILHPELGVGREIDPFWREMFERIDLLSKLQVLVCPDSQTHREESALAPYAAELKRIYELFSHGTTFDFGTEVLEHQLLEYLQNWLAGDPDRPLDLTPEAVIHGQLHGWLERYTITVGGLDGDDWVDELRAARERGAENIAAVHEGWRNMQPFDFDAVYRRELRSFGAGTLEQHLRAVQQQARVLAGDEPYDINALLPSSSTSLVLSIHHYMREAGIADAELWPKTARFFMSGKLENVPYLRISCLLFTAMARKAAAGQVRPPNRGTLNDVKTVATVLPYCDAVFVDNEIAAFLSEEPIRSRVGFETRVFSPNRRDEFLGYLDDLRDAVPDQHVALVREVYSDSWLEPFTGVFDEHDSE
jgi:hypothetical protein